MEYGSQLRWGAAIVGIVLLLIASIIGLVFIGRSIFSGGGQVEQAQTESFAEKYNRPNVRVSVETQGPVVAKEDFNVYKLIVSRTDRVMQVINGYDGSIVKEQRLSNTESAFEVFLKALDKAGFDRVNRSYKNEDEEGACATGKRYIYKIEESGAEVFRAWRVSCSTDIGTSAAPRAARTLFQKQFPDFSKFTSGLGLN